MSATKSGSIIEDSLDSIPRDKPQEYRKEASSWSHRKKDCINQ
jgi:hypothetical protein